MRDLLEDQDIAVILETGVNQQQRLLLPQDNLEVGRNNKMNDTKNS